MNGDGWSTGAVTVSVDADFVATVELHRPPNNFFDVALIRSLAEAYELVDGRRDCRAVVLCSEGKHFCAGADFAPADPPVAGAQPASSAEGSSTLYDEALRLFAAATPVVAAVQGAAVGGGLGLACSADFRVAAPEARFSANFARLGFHHGFALSATLPAIVGHQHALDLLLHRPAHRWGRGVGLRLVRPAGRCRRAPRCGAPAGRRGRGVGAPGRAQHPRHPACRTARQGPPGCAGPKRSSRTGCAGPVTGPKACGPWPSGARRGSRGDDDGGRRRDRHGAR